LQFYLNKKNLIISNTVYKLHKYIVSTIYNQYQVGYNNELLINTNYHTLYMYM